MSTDRIPSLKISQYKKSLWILAILITISSAVYQRLTGPTYPIRGSVTLESSVVPFKLLRSETTDRDVSITLSVSDTAIGGYVKYKRYRSHDEWTQTPLQRSGETLQAFLPRQPAAGKIIYYVYLVEDDTRLSLTGDEAVILRYKGPVPATVLIPHVLIMFLAMLFSNRAALEALDAAGKPKKLMLYTVAFFLVGGFILGPAVQKYAFVEFWTGFPFGYDLTDNKTLFAMLGWLFAWFKNRNNHSSRMTIIFAALLLLAVYLIPHSVLGSELDYTQMEPQTD
ncbi:MAG: hypothetical protein JSW33_03995 [bacterium]|nr:MAG: hypothetical protein JSW33_03995 [bacterium]